MLQIHLDADPTQLTAALQQKGWLNADESITTLEKPGEGNMNVVLRMLTNQRSLILKQSRPFVNKYPDIPAPLDRLAVEHQFYQQIEGADVDHMVPTVLAYDSQQYLLLMEDLGAGTDLTMHYTDRKIPSGDVNALLDFLRKVHQQTAKDYPANLGLRELNHQHIFVLPFLEENGFPLDEVQEGLQSLSRLYKADAQLKSRIEALGKEYLSEGQTLLHGDYYPGSWLRSNDQVYVIDPEFSFLGYPEFDLGVMVAHLMMIEGNDAALAVCLNGYGLSLREKKVQQIAGIEIMRRIIGLAQLPWQRSLEEKDQLLQMARKMIMV